MASLRTPGGSSNPQDYQRKKPTRSNALQAFDRVGLLFDWPAASAGPSFSHPTESRYGSGPAFMLLRWNRDNKWIFVLRIPGSRPDLGLGEFPALAHIGPPWSNRNQRDCSMAENNEMGGEGIQAEVLQRALLLACQRIADGSQLYDEVKTADGWCELFIKHAESEDEAGASES
jgi:hypothetical protein